MASIREEQSALLALLGQTLFGKACSLPREPDWSAVLREAKQQAVLPLAWEAAKSCLSGPEAEAIDASVSELLVNNMYIDFDHVELHEAMRAAGIGYVVMKGSASAAYYPQPMLRMMGDVDFLVHREDAERAGQVLRELGFRETAERDDPIHQAYVGLRHLKRMARGKRPMLQIDRTVAGAEQRSRLYRQLRLFEQERDG